MAASEPFQRVYDAQRRRQYEAIGAGVDSAALVKSAKYGQRPVQPQRESFGDSVARSLVPAAAEAAGGLIGSLFNRQSTTPPNPFSSSFDVNNVIQGSFNPGLEAISGGPSFSANLPPLDFQPYNWNPSTTFGI